MTSLPPDPPCAVGRGLDVPTYIGECDQPGDCELVLTADTTVTFPICASHAAELFSDFVRAVRDHQAADPDDGEAG